MRKLFSEKTSELNYYKVIFFRILLALFFFWLSRLLFYVFNTNYFPGLSFTETLKILLFGLRFDLSAILMINAPFLILMTVPVSFRRLKAWRVFSDIIFYTANILGLMANFMDVVYYRFTQKRMTGDIFKFADEIDAIELLPQFTKDYWHYQLVFLLFAGALIYFGNKRKYQPRKNQLKKVTNFAYQMLGFIITLTIIIVGIRGGLQLKPINIITAGKVSEAKNAAFVLNTPFTIIKTINMNVLKPRNYFPDKALDEIYNPVYTAANKSGEYKKSSPKNVIIIIFESLSSEHVGALNKDIQGYVGFTSFLDSLMEHGVVFNGFANGKQSIEGVPSILSSLPSLMDRPYINSAYAGNKINSLASLLNKKGYHTSFFHGGTNGTMDFDGFADIAGFDNYYGRTEYNNEANFDGNWGIFDEPFLQYFAHQLTKTSKPFFSTIFTLSSHHPYTIPKKYSGKFREGNLEIQQSILYADFSLMKFFETAKTQPWYDETLFVITADHTSEAYLEKYKTKVGIYQVPVIFFAPNQKPTKQAIKTASQVDIMPSVLGLLEFDLPFVSFGNDLFDDQQNSYSVNYLSGVYQIIQNNMVLQFDGENSLALYNFKNDPLLKQNLLSEFKEKATDLEKYLKAYIQQYNKHMIENRLTVKP